MKKMKLKDEQLQTDPEDFTSVGRATQSVVDRLIDGAVNNPQPDMLQGAVLEGDAKKMLASFVERWERLEEERAAVVTDMAEVMKEAEGYGFDRAALSTLLKWRKKDPSDVRHTLGIVQTYHDALGMDVLP